MANANTNGLTPSLSNGGGFSFSDFLSGLKDTAKTASDIYNDWSTQQSKQDEIEANKKAAELDANVKLQLANNEAITGLEFSKVAMYAVAATVALGGLYFITKWIK